MATSRYDSAVEQAYQAFREEVKRRGLMERAYGYYAVYALLAFSAVAFGLYAITLTDNFWLQMLNSVLLTCMLVQVGTIGHDLSHNQVFKSKKVNRFFAMFVWGLVGGMSETHWYGKHNAHHEAPNKMGHDPDLQIPFVFSANQIPERSMFFKKWILPYQHVLFFLALPFIYITWVFFSMRTIFANFSFRTFVELCLMTIRFAVLFYILFTFLPVWTAVAFLIVSFCVTGLYMSIVFAPNHKGQEVWDEDEEETWQHQVISTRNLYPTWLIFHVFSGLNLQIEHHLFSNMARINYMKVQPLMKQFCKDNNLPYHETSFFGSMKEIYNSLREQAMRAPSFAR